jgi:peptide/nickel transport system substrate-binding protein
MGAVAVGPFKGNFDLTIINHVEPLDFMQLRRPGVLLGLRQPEVRRPGQADAEAPRGDMRVKLYGDIQRLLTQDAVNAWIFNPAQVAVSKKGLKGLWSSSPIFANDMSQVSWQ